MDDKTKLAENINQIFVRANQKTDIEGIKLVILDYLDKTEQISEYLYDSVVNASEYGQFLSLRGFCEVNAFRWLKTSASLGNPRAYLILGKMYHVSEGITRNYEKSFRAWKKAANITSKYQPSAQNLLAIYYYRGRGTNKDMHAAIKTHINATKSGKSSYFSKLLHIIFKKLR
ncbi:11971_t:CDS:2 [Ambispora gerdemannii]|uniref:11971_t:CDS:1 n=1 Tax=Ambispora gerdemannii TaxID=144530 RepID=A0A9N8WQM6_9GLOM|nr:11971_t:CDS:2 [Ambispora gerdemannii]